MEIYDVVIVGAGLSGIGAAYHIQDKCPNKSYTILEARSSMGGTWDLFRYPGVRSDSDMYTLGFSFYPWKNPKAIADGPSILNYIKETAGVFGIDQHIQYNRKVTHACWSTEEKLWTIEIAPYDEVGHREIKCNFLFMCSGYYSYEEGHNPEFKGKENFEGPVIHPQQWDHELDYEDKKVVIVGSGATAVTLVPEMAKKAQKVTMLQRSPSYIMNMPSEDGIANTLKKLLPSRAAHTISRWKNILMSLLFYNLSQKFPEWMSSQLKKGVAREVGEKYEEKHFDPDYNPWDQRLCLVPDNDLFEVIREGKAEVVTDTIDHFVRDGIWLTSGKRLDADIVITATGLKMQLFGGMKVEVDGKEVDMSEEHAYRGVMISNIPNFAVAVGYTNASWTLKCDLNCLFVCRVIKQMDKDGKQMVVPRFDPELGSEDLIDLSSGYIQRGKAILPKQGGKMPWKIHQNYLKDLRALKHGKVDDGWLVYG